MPGRIRHDETTGCGFEKTVGHIDGDALFALSHQSINQQRKVDAFGTGNAIAAVTAKLSELMLIEVVRRHLEALPPGQAGWLAGFRDPFVGKALALMHGDPARNWTLEELAREIGLSRSVLAERFAGLVGLPPMQYLAKWRMQIASGLLSGGGANMATVAAEIGGVADYGDVVSNWDLVFFPNDERGVAGA